ncbi:MAG TPA: ABC transporter substrate-binding protein [Thermoanaerobacterales bacterium]|nr:ABC transporter substrate-binding protein [Thermoanaerobacterales bacterium]
MKKLFILLLVFMVIGLSGCTNSKNGSEKSAAPQAESGSEIVKIGILPDVDSVPFIAADIKGYFNKEGVKVELVSFKNPVERDAALQGGAIDGEVGDILAAAFAVQNGLDVKITSITNGKYDILVAPNSNIKDANGLKGKKVALSKNTIIEYAVDRMLSQKGLSDGDIEKVVVAQMPVRLEMLKSGKVDAACLPEPLSTLAVKSGARLLLSTRDISLAPGIMLFTQKAIDSKGNYIKKVYEAYEKVTSDINANPENFRDVLSTAHFPEEVVGTFEFPHYTGLSVPSESDIKQVMDWMKARGMLKKQLTYEELVDDTFVKK